MIRRFSVGIRCLKWLGPLCALILSVHAQATLQITTPTPGTIVSPGETFAVYVTASGGPFLALAIIAYDPIGGGGSQLLTAPPYQFAMTIPPATTPGLYPLSAFGKTSTGTFVDSEPIMIDVERADSPRTITPDLTQLGMAVGDRDVILLTGTYADGSQVYLHKSTQTRWILSSPGIVAVGPQGQITALRVGSVALTITHKQKTVIVPILVKSDPR